MSTKTTAQSSKHNTNDVALVRACVRIVGSILQVFGGALQVFVLYYRVLCCALCSCGRYLWLVAG